MKGDRRVRLVARREFVERVRDKGFLISTAITVVVLAGFILMSAFLDKGVVYDVGVLGETSREPVAKAAVFATGADIRIRLRVVGTPEAAEAGLRDGTLDGVVVNGEYILTEAGGDERLLEFLQGGSQLDRLGGQIPPLLPVRSLERSDPNRKAVETVAFVGVLILYGQLFGYGVWVAGGVVEEKSSRVVELLLATVRPFQLLAGKVLGIGLLGLAQLLLIASVGLTVGLASGRLEFPERAFSIAGVVLLWFALGFAFYSTLFAVAGSLVSRQEELQNVLAPINLVIIGALILSIHALRDPGGTTALVSSLLPPLAPLTMPPRIALGEATWVEVVASIVLSVGATIAMIPLAARIYSGAVLRTGARIKLRDAWRAER